MAYEAEHLLGVQNRLGEGVRWHAAEQALYWVDIENGLFFRYYPSSGQYEQFEVGLPLGVLGFRSSGGLIMATKRGFATWDFSTPG